MIYIIIIRGNCLKHRNRGWNRKEGRGHKDFKKGGQAGSSGGCLKKRGGMRAGTPLQTMRNHIGFFVHIELFSMNFLCFIVEVVIMGYNHRDAYWAIFCCNDSCNVNNCFNNLFQSGFKILLFVPSCIILWSRLLLYMVSCISSYIWLLGMENF